MVYTYTHTYTYEIFMCTGAHKHRKRERERERYIYIVHILIHSRDLTRWGTCKNPGFAVPIGGSGGLSPPERSRWPPHPAKGWAVGASAGPFKGPSLIQLDVGEFSAS